MITTEIASLSTTEFQKGLATLLEAIKEQREINSMNNEIVEVATWESSYIDSNGQEVNETHTSYSNGVVYTNRH